jgi:GTP-binding protein
MEIKSATFTISSAKLSQCPQDDKMEFAFIGRSNVGKSSLINMLTGHKGLAKTSATPGKTLLINHFLINGEWYIIDLPGYGFAKRSKSVQRSIDDMITSYILHREQLVNVFLLIDVRHEPQRIDTEFMNWLGENGVPFSIVFTKADKLSASKLRANVDAYLQSLLDTWEELPPYFVTSSEKKQGREPLLDYIESILLGSSGS